MSSLSEEFNSLNLEVGHVKSDKKDIEPLNKPSKL